MSKDLALFTLVTVHNYDITQLYADVSKHSSLYSQAERR